MFLAPSIMFLAGGFHHSCSTPIYCIHFQISYRFCLINVQYSCRFFSHNHNFPSFCFQSFSNLLVNFWNHFKVSRSCFFFVRVPFIFFEIFIPNLFRHSHGPRVAYKCVCQVLCSSNFKSCFMIILKYACRKFYVLFPRIWLSLFVFLVIGMPIFFVIFTISRLFFSRISEFCGSFFAFAQFLKRFFPQFF